MNLRPDPGNETTQLLELRISDPDHTRIPERHR